MKKYVLLFFFAFSIQAQSLSEQEAAAIAYLNEFHAKLRVAELATLHLEEDKDYPWDVQNRPYENYDSDINPELSAEEYAKIDRFDFAKSHLVVAVTMASAINEADDKDHQINYMKEVYSGSDDEVDIFCLNYAVENWQVYEGSPEQYLRNIWSVLMSTNLNQFIYQE